MDNPFIFDLIKKGYGTYNELINLPVDVVIDMLQYEDFTREMEDTYASYQRRETLKQEKNNNVRT